MEFRLIGPLEAVDDNGQVVPLGGLKQRSVLACLLAEAGRVCSVDRLVEAGWGDGLPADPKATLQVAISRLRKLLGRDLIVAKAPGYVLRIGADDRDAWVFDRLVAEAERSADDGAHGAVVDRCN